MYIFKLVELLINSRASVWETHEDSKLWIEVKIRVETELYEIITACCFSDSSPHSSQGTFSQPSLKLYNVRTKRSEIMFMECS